MRYLRDWRTVVVVLVCAAVVITVGVLLLGDDDEEQGRPSSYDVELGDQFVAYCDEVEEQQQPLTEALAGGPTTGLIDALPSFRALADKAPDDLDDEWGVVLSRVEELVAVLEGAGVDPSTYDRKDPPAGLDPAERRAIDAAATALVARDTATAMAGVQQHARDVCKAPLSL